MDIDKQVNNKKRKSMIDDYSIEKELILENLTLMVEEIQNTVKELMILVNMV